jgi:hypothetical protein
MKRKQLFKEIFRKGFVFPVFIVLLLSDQQVSSYSTGKYGTSDYENISFWIKNGKRSDITYSFGARPKVIRLQFAGNITKDQDTIFKVRFPNNLVLFIRSAGNDLIIADSNQNYRKIFKWEYEGPVNGIGTFCEPCATDEKQAISWMKQYYFR